METHHDRIDVSAGIIIRQGRILICRRPDTPFARGLWEFPGGKREIGETPAQCLVRECREELGITVQPGAVFADFVWTGDARRVIHFTFMTAGLARGEPQCLEHQAVEWISPGMLSSYVFCPADASIIQAITAAFG